jgi:hypothetical protein
MTQIFNLLDVNNDGVLTKLELSNLGDSVFAVSHLIPRGVVPVARKCSRRKPGLSKGAYSEFLNQ